MRGPRETQVQTPMPPCPSPPLQLSLSNNPTSSLEQTQYLPSTEQSSSLQQPNTIVAFKTSSLQQTVSALQLSLSNNPTSSLEQTQYLPSTEQSSSLQQPNTIVAFKTSSLQQTVSALQLSLSNNPTSSLEQTQSSSSLQQPNTILAFNRAILIPSTTKHIICLKNLSLQQPHNTRVSTFNRFNRALFHNQCTNATNPVFPRILAHIPLTTVQKVKRVKQPSHLTQL